MKFVACELIHPSQQQPKPKSEQETSYFVGSDELDQHLKSVFFFFCREHVTHLNNLKSRGFSTLISLGI
jgi:hypothetical protein